MKYHVLRCRGREREDGERVALLGEGLAVIVEGVEEVEEVASR
jgi:hypothetical protein